MTSAEGEGFSPGRPMRDLRGPESRPGRKPVRRPARPRSIVFDVRALLRGQVQDQYPDLPSAALHVLEVLTSDAWYGAGEDFLWVPEYRSDSKYLAHRTGLSERQVQDATEGWLDTARLIGLGIDGRYTIYPLAYRFLGSELVPPGYGRCQLVVQDGQRLFPHWVSLEQYPNTVRLPPDRLSLAEKLEADLSPLPRRTAANGKGPARRLIRREAK